ncbi:Inositol oxygenase [Macleaya cordata]|uniref:Inositol oxygenase n=1 Tax=Macleaya cordata TaxID=56857 RepID=A0A200QVI0_MACCD|nr:Inositol oxygenase [Macleaya cordata]
MAILIGQPQLVFERSSVRGFEIHIDDRCRRIPKIHAYARLQMINQIYFPSTWFAPRNPYAFQSNQNPKIQIKSRVSSPPSSYYSVGVRRLHSCAYSTIEVDEKKISNSNDTNTLVLDGGFFVPKTNSFGQNFRDYDVETDGNKRVEEFYRMNRSNQSYDFVKTMREKYGKLDKIEMSIWECCELLNEFVDESDPDLDEPQIEHLLQTAEAIRKDYPDQDWLHLTGLIHDLGKVLLHPSFGGLPQWAVVGDTFPVGCAFDESNIHFKYFKDNPDYNNPDYNTKNGIYDDGCGLNNVMMSWGHDDYMYLVAKENETTLPSAGLFIIRYHSFYLFPCKAEMVKLVPWRYGTHELVEEVQKELP